MKVKKIFRILFIKSVINTSIFSFDIGLGTLSAILKEKNYTVDLFVVKRWDQVPRLLSHIKLTKPNMIGFSSYASSIQSSAELSKLIRKKFPSLHQIIGGVHLILNPEEISNLPTVNAVCTGEGEIALPEYISNYRKHNKSHIHTPGFWVRYRNKIVRNKPARLVVDLDTLPFPDRSIFAMQGISNSRHVGQMTLDLLFTRGCPFNCTYCSNHALKRKLGTVKYIRQMSPKRAIELIIHDASTYAFDYLKFHDDTFTYEKKWLYEFLKLYRKIKIPFICNLRVNTVSKQDLILLKKCGCISVYVGVESGDSHLRLQILRRGMTNEAIIQTFDWAKETGMHTAAFLMMGLPYETPRSFFETVKIIKRAAPDHVMMGIFYPYPGTDLFKTSQEAGFLKTNQPKDFVERKDSLLEMPQFPRKDILYYHERFNQLVNYIPTGNSIFSHPHGRLKFLLLATPPSSIWFKITNTLTFFDDILMKLLGRMKLPLIAIGKSN